MEYRREIDGLRALAVVPVILFHAGFEWFAGGFVGVDVFFVISGYLITGIILAELSAGRFSLLTFYERRARRILPALLLVMTVSFALAWLWLVPADMQELAKSYVAVSLFSSNVLFWRDSGYFSTAAELKPMLHTWSLAVEEQYYVLFPVFLMVAWRWGRRRMVGVLVLVALASLAVAEWGVRNNPGAAFFLLPTRAWELLLGSLIAFFQSGSFERGWVFPPWVRQVGGILGLGLVVLAVLTFSKHTPFPGFFALMPAVGTGLIILFATPDTWAGRLLGQRLLLGVGLISYSAYLWHQPLFAFARHRSLDTPSPWLYGALALASLALAWLSWRFVETPFRNKGVVSRAQVFRFAALAVALPLCVGLAGYATNGFYGRTELQSRLGDLESRLAGNLGLNEACEGDFTLSPLCRNSDTPEILLWGDSHAMHLLQGITASNPDARVVQMTISVCGPVMGVAPTNARYTPSWASKCIAANEKVMEWLNEHRTVKYAVLSSSFSFYVSPGSRLMQRNGEVVDGPAETLASFKATLRELRRIGVTPVVVSTTPQNGKDIGRCLAKMSFLEQPLNLCSFDRHLADIRQKRVLDFLREVEGDARVIWLADGMCPNGTCQASESGVFIYRDNGHLSREGSAYIGKKMDFYRAITSAP